MIKSNFRDWLHVEKINWTQSDWKNKQQKYSKKILMQGFQNLEKKYFG